MELSMEQFDHLRERAWVREAVRQSQLSEREFSHPNKPEPKLTGLRALGFKPKAVVKAAMAHGLCHAPALPPPTNMGGGKNYTQPLLRLFLAIPKAAFTNNEFMDFCTRQGRVFNRMAIHNALRRAVEGNILNIVRAGGGRRATVYANKIIQ